MSLTNRFNLPPEILKTFFLSAFLDSITDIKDLQEFMRPMIRVLGVKRGVASAIINAVSPNQAGWEIIGTSLSKATVLKWRAVPSLQSRSTTHLNIFELLRIFLSLINWKKLRSQLTNKTMNSEMLKLTSTDLVD